MFGMNAIIVVGSSNVGVRAASGYSAMRLAESCRSTYAYGAVTVHSRELGCLDRRVMRLKAASAVEAHRRQPHFIPVRVVAIGKRLHLQFRRSDKLLISQNVDGSMHIGIMGPEFDCVRCLSGSNRRGSNEKRIPKRFFRAFFLSVQELVIRPFGLASIGPALFADAKLNNEL